MREPIDAVVMAGGRISGPYAQAAGTTVKALAPLWDEPAVRHVVRALREARGVGRVCVVGPPPVGELVRGHAHWEPETDSALGNLLAGFRALERESPPERVLVCGADVPALAPAALDDFLSRAPAGADVALPVIRRERFMETFPRSENIYVHLREGAFTGGSQFLLRPRAVRENAVLMQTLFDRRKSQVGMVRALGAGFVWRLLTRQLTVPELESRLGTLTGCDCRAVLDCAAELAYDIDHAGAFHYLRTWSPPHLKVSSKNP